MSAGILDVEFGDLMRVYIEDQDPQSPVRFAPIANFSLTVDLTKINESDTWKLAFGITARDIGTVNNIFSVNQSYEDGDQKNLEQGGPVESVWTHATGETPWAFHGISLTENEDSLFIMGRVSVDGSRFADLSFVLRRRPDIGEGKLLWTKSVSFYQNGSIGGSGGIRPDS